MFLATGARREAVDTNILNVFYLWVLVLGGSVIRIKVKLVKHKNRPPKTKINLLWVKLKKLCKGGKKKWYQPKKKVT